jgi:16S rRNA processing protein RimM
MELLVTGIIRSSHGVNGFVKVESTSGEVDHLMDLKGIDLRSGGINGTIKRYEIERIEGSAICLLMKLKGIETPEQAKTLAGLELVVPRDMACPLEDGEYYVNDLCQCVLMYKGTLVGTITGVMEGGAGDLLEVTLSESGGFGEDKSATRILPLRKEFVGKIDIKAKTVELMHRWILE